MTTNVGNGGFVEYVDHMGSDLTVVNAARVSFNKNSVWEETWKDSDNGLLEVDYSLSQKDQRLVKYLAKHQHWTPFAHCQITLHIKAPMPIRTQFFKHKVGFVENEISRRYVDEPPHFFFPVWAGRPENMKQGAGDILDVDTRNKAYLIYEQQMRFANDAYQSLLNLGVAPEQARFVLPQATYTEWYWTGSLAAYARFYKQRSDPHAQAEIQDYAKAIAKIIQPLFPTSWDVLTNSGNEPQ